MSGLQFFQTRMGVRFFEKDVPALIKAINRLADATEKQCKLMETVSRLLDESSPTSSSGEKTGWNPPLSSTQP